MFWKDFPKKSVLKKSLAGNCFAGACLEVKNLSKLFPYITFYIFWKKFCRQKQRRSAKLSDFQKWTARLRFRSAGTKDYITRDTKISQYGVNFFYISHVNGNFCFFCNVADWCSKSTWHNCFTVKISNNCFLLNTINNKNNIRKYI